MLISLLATQPTPAAHPAAATVILGKVTKVIDGDTIDVLLSSGLIRVRLHGVDAPESAQPGGAAATRWLTLELQNQQVQLEPVSQDQYDRMVAVVHREDRNINRELVQTGHAWAYRQYMRRSDEHLCMEEERARLKGAGLWATTAYAPWEYRLTKGKGPFTSFAGTTARSCSNAIGRKTPWHSISP
ncbi:MAG: thermonuclease family protein [Pseudomonadota bacterium]